MCPVPARDIEGTCGSQVKSLFCLPMTAAAGGNLWSSLFDVNDDDDDDDDDGSNTITLVSFQGSKLKKSPSGLLATNWRNIVARCKFLVASLYNVNDAAHSIS